MPDHNFRTIDSYTKEDFELAVNAIAAQGQAAAGKPFKPYADTTIQHFRHLIEVVVKAASEQGYCDNVLWGSRFSLHDSSASKDKVKERTRLKKSLTPREEFLVMIELLSNPYQSGERMGLLLMYAFGLRNSEACAINFGDIKPMIGSLTYKVLWAYKSTVGATNTLKSSGKTKNANRVIPVAEAVEAFLQKRREYLQQQGFEDIDRLPIACNGSKFDERCTSPRLTAAGRELLRKINLNATELALIDEALAQDELSDFLGEKDPTAYLLRRNFATHLYLLDLTESEIQYIMGHEIESAYESRSDFVNEEELLKICKKMAQRPLLNSLQPNADVVCTAPETVTFSGTRQRIVIDFPSHVSLTISSAEPGDPVDIHFALSQESPAIEVFRKPNIDPQYPRTLNTLSSYQSLYLKNRKPTKQEP